METSSGRNGRFLQSYPFLQWLERRNHFIDPWQYCAAAMPRPEGKDMPLYRSRQHKLIAGVCGGIADYLGWNPNLVRIGYAVVSIASAAFPGTIAYVVLWLVMPKEPG